MKRNVILIVLLGVSILVFGLIAREAGFCSILDNCQVDEVLVDVDSETKTDDKVDLLGQVPIHPDIQLSSVIHDRLASSIIIEGKAKGTWFFEGDFPAVLVDGSGEEIIAVPVSAKGDWMTEDFVLFSAEIGYTYQGEALDGFLILQKNNPSDMRELDDQLKIPLILSISSPDTAEEMVISIYLIPAGTGGENCELVEPVDRRIPYTRSVARAALEELFKGPTDSEFQSGYTTALEGGESLQSIRIEDGVVYANIQGLPSGGACRVGAARAQLEQTLLQFSTTESVVLADETGNTEELLQP